MHTAAPALPGDPAAAWACLREQALLDSRGLRVPASRQAGLCQACRGPAAQGSSRCFQCRLHAESAPGLLADAMVPVAYAVNGGRHARRLWLYKAGQPGSAAAGAALRAMLLVFLSDHGACLWRAAGMAAPTHACVVPSGRGRPGPHPLHALIAPYLALPWAGLVPCPGADRWARDLDPGRFRVQERLAGACVLLLDDTWTSGASCQSAAIALRRAGARRVAVAVLGRHLRLGAATGAAGERAARFTPALCALPGAHPAPVNRLGG